jgi:hypothetical protein
MCPHLFSGSVVSLVLLALLLPAIVRITGCDALDPRRRIAIFYSAVYSTVSSVDTH